MKNYITAAHESPNVPITDKMAFERILSFANIYKSSIPLANYAAFMLLRQYDGLNDEAEKKANTDELEEYMSQMFPIEILFNSFTPQTLQSPFMAQLLDIKTQTQSDDFLRFSAQEIERESIRVKTCNTIESYLQHYTNNPQNAIRMVHFLQLSYMAIPQTIHLLTEGVGVAGYASKYNDFLNRAYILLRKDNLINVPYDNKLPNGALICYTYPNSSDAPVHMRIDERRRVGIRERSIRIYKSENADAAINIDSYNLINCPSDRVESTLRSCQKFLGDAFSSLNMLAEMGERVKNEFLEYQKAQSAKK